jgi:hypothetical protein
MRTPKEARARTPEHNTLLQGLNSVVLYAIYLQIPFTHALQDGPRLWGPMRKRSSQSTENSPKTYLKFVTSDLPLWDPAAGKCTSWHDTAPLHNAGCHYALVSILIPRKDSCASKFN